VLAEGSAFLEALARARPLDVVGTDDGERPAGVVASRLGAAWFSRDEAQTAGGAARRDAQAEHLRRGIERLQQLLGNEGFVGRAPAEVVARERERLAELEAQLAQLEG